MITTIDNKQYKIFFGYLNQVISLKKVPTEVRSTSCNIVEIREVQDNRPELGQIVASSFAHCSKNDTFKKDEGRKRALKKALLSSNFNKTERSLFWQTYLNRK